MNAICKGAIVGCLAGVGIGGAWAYQADDTVDVAFKRAAAVGGAATGVGGLVGVLVLQRTRRRRAVERALTSVLGPVGLSRMRHLSRRVRRQLRRLDVGKLDAAKLDVAALTGSARRQAGEATEAARQRVGQATDVARQRAGDAAVRAVDAVSQAREQTKVQADDLADRAGGAAKSLVGDAA